MDNKNQHRMMQGAEIYHRKAQVYDRFSQAEDHLKLIEKFLKPRIKDKTVLDLGCGAGKYLTLAPLTQKYYALDYSREQLAIAIINVNQKNVYFLQSSAQNIALPDQSIDIVLASWLFGSILDLRIRAKVLDEAERDSKTIYAIENYGDCEFEQIIKRYPDISTT